MAEQIKDGTGKGFAVKVSPDNRLHTLATTSSAETESNERGDAYNINTDIINLSDALETTILYFKNNEDRDFIIVAVVVGIFTSAVGDGADMVTTFIRNPTTGDIITNKNVAPVIGNRNYGSPNVLTGDVYIGASTETKVNGDDHIIVRVTEDSRTFVGINEVLPKGTSFAVNITPPTSNNAMNVYAAIIGYIHAPE